MPLRTAVQYKTQQDAVAAPDLMLRRMDRLRVSRRPNDRTRTTEQGRSEEAPPPEQPASPNWAAPFNSARSWIGSRAAALLRAAAGSADDASKDAADEESKEKGQPTQDKGKKRAAPEEELP